MIFNINQNQTFLLHILQPFTEWLLSGLFQSRSFFSSKIFVCLCSLTCTGKDFFLFMENSGNIVIMNIHNLPKKILFYVCSADPFFGQGNSFHGTGGRGSKLAQMRYGLRVLKSVVSLYDDAVNLNLCDQGAISQLLGKARFLLLTVVYFFSCLFLQCVFSVLLLSNILRCVHPRYKK